MIQLKEREEKESTEKEGDIERIKRDREEAKRERKRDGDTE